MLITKKEYSAEMVTHYDSRGAKYSDSSKYLNLLVCFQELINERRPPKIKIIQVVPNSLCKINLHAK